MGKEYVTLYSGGLFSKIGSWPASSQACPSRSPSFCFRTPKTILVGIPYSARYRCRTAARFQHIGRKTNTSIPSRRSSSCAIRSPEGNCFDGNLAGVRGVISFKTRGKGCTLMSAESKTTQPAIRDTSNASRGVRIMNRLTNNRRDANLRTWPVIVFLILLISGVAAPDGTDAASLAVLVMSVNRP
jgi:hypothetical protein